jgi:hypothetical protein
MDFPNSQPDVGLVGGVFVDENPATGQPGSRIPAAWGNAVTRELLNVIEAAGLEPDDAQTDQLLQAIRTLVPERSAFARVSGTLTLPATAFGVYALGDGGAAATVTLPSVDDLVDDTELLLFANHANTAAIQVKAAIGQAVQGPAALMGASTTAFMLPAGGDWVRLRSEKAHGRWVVAGCYQTAQMLALGERLQLLEDSPAIAWGAAMTKRKWTPVDRLANVNYTNDTPCDIEIRVRSNTGTNNLKSVFISVSDDGGATWIVILCATDNSTANPVATGGLTVPPGYLYKFNEVNGANCWELRYVA